jgi:cytochrome P450
MDQPAPLRRVRDLPGPAGQFIMGASREINRRPLHLVLEDWARVYGPLYRFHIMGRQFVVTSDREQVAALLRDRPDAFRRPLRTQEMLEEIGTRGLFTAEGDEWRRQRKLVMRALTPEVVHRFFPTLAAMTERLRQRWQRALEEGRPVDLLRDLKAYTLDVTVGLAMGQDINTLEVEDNPLQRDIDFLFKLVARRLTSPFAYWRLPLLRRAHDREAQAAAQRIQQAIAGFVAQARRRLQQQPALRAQPSNMLEALVVACDEPGSGFTDAAVVGNAITMVFAGEDTTSNTLAWLIDYLADAPEAQAALAREAAAVLGSDTVPGRQDMLDQLPWLEAAVREAMRLKPVAPFLPLEAVHDTPVGDLLLPAGTTIFLMMRHAAERDTELPEPQRFQPERWLAQAGGSGDDPARKHFPFGGGPRFCPGRYLAMAEIKMVMSMLAANFSLRRNSAMAPAQEKFTFTMTPGHLPVDLAEKAC